MSYNANIDFDKISAKIQEEIERRNHAVLAKNPSANLASVNQAASIAEIICLTALKAYHEEMVKDQKPD